MVDDVGERVRYVQGLSELYRHVVARLVLEIESGHYPGGALPHRRLFVGHGLVGGDRLGRRNRDAGLFHGVFDEVVVEPQGVGAGGHAFDDIVPVGIGDGEVGGVVHPYQHVADGLGVRRVGHGTGYPSAV